jgi:Ca2+-binding RTX toxin-like protein
MAVFFFGPSVRVDTYTLTLDTFTPGDVGDYDFFSGSSTELRFFDDANNFTALQGTGFVYSTFFGVLTDISDGELTGIEARVAGETLATVSGWSLLAAEVFQLVLDDDTVGLRNLLLRGNDTITLSDRSDRATGGAGNDHLIGLKGHDKLNGGNGNDTVDGGIGRDTLTGGAGEDVFLFSVKARDGFADTITDFVSGEDEIHLVRDIFRGGGPIGVLQDSRFALDAATTADHRIIYVQATGQLIWDKDGTGATAGIVFAQVAPGTDLTAGDIFFV